MGNAPASVISADVNGDGKADLISANYNVSGTLTVLTNNGSGGFVISSSPVVGDAPASVTAADMNGDGRPDLIGANFGSGTLTVLTNNGSGGCVSKSDSAGASQLRRGPPPSKPLYCGDGTARSCRDLQRPSLTTRHILKIASKTVAALASALCVRSA